MAGGRRSSTTRRTSVMRPWSPRGAPSRSASRSVTSVPRLGRVELEQDRRQRRPDAVVQVAAQSLALLLAGGDDPRPGARSSPASWAARTVTAACRARSCSSARVGGARAGGRRAPPRRAARARSSTVHQRHAHDLVPVVAAPRLRGRHPDAVDLERIARPTRRWRRRAQQVGRLDARAEPAQRHGRVGAVAVDPSLDRAPAGPRTPAARRPRRSRRRAGRRRCCCRRARSAAERRRRRAQTTAATQHAVGQGAAEHHLDVEQLVPQDRDPDREREPEPGQQQGDTHRQRVVAEHEVPDPDQRQRQRAGSSPPRRATAAAAARPGRAPQPDPHRERRAEEQQHGQDQPDDPEHRDTGAGSQGSGGSVPSWAPGTRSASPAEPTRNAADPDEPAQHPAAPPRRQCVAVGDQVARSATSQRKRNTQEPARAGRRPSRRLVPVPSGELSSTPKHTPWATSSQPMRRCPAQEHQGADERRRPRPPGARRPVHPPSVEAPGVVRNRCPGTVPGAVGTPGSCGSGRRAGACSCSPRGRRPRWNREEPTCAQQLREAAALERAPSPASAGSARTSCSRTSTEDLPGGASTGSSATTSA